MKGKHLSTNPNLSIKTISLKPSKTSPPWAMIAKIDEEI
jgi:hypothetical protein